MRAGQALHGDAAAGLVLQVQCEEAQSPHEALVPPLLAARERQTAPRGSRTELRALRALRSRRRRKFNCIDVAW